LPTAGNAKQKLVPALWHALLLLARLDGFAYLSQPMLRRA